MRIGIVGAGPAGLVASIAGAELGLDVTLFERFSKFKPAGAGFGLQSNGFRVLEALGLLDGFLPKLNICHVYVHQLGRRRSVAYDFGELPVPHNYFAVAIRHELQEHLLKSALERGVNIRIGHRCTGVDINNGRAVLRFENYKEEEFDVVVACDGAHSVVRENAGAEFRKKYIDQAYLRGVAPVPSNKDVFVEIWGEDGRIFGICPLPGDRTFFFCSAPLENWQEIRDNSLEEWIESWRGYGDQVMSLLRAVSNWRDVNYDNRLCEIYMKRWYKIPVFFAGDSAHAMRPNYGQGANCAMVDSLVLMRLLAEVVEGRISLGEAGKRYDSIRRPFVTEIQRRSGSAGVMSGWTSPTSRWLRDTAFELFSKIGFLRRWNLLLASGYNKKEEPFLTPLRKGS